jgi:hypothetical protein
MYRNSKSDACFLIVYKHLLWDHLLDPILVRQNENIPSQSLLCITEIGDANVSQSKPNMPPIIGFIPASSLEVEQDVKKVTVRVIMLLNFTKRLLILLPNATEKMPCIH